MTGAASRDLGEERPELIRILDGIGEFVESSHSKSTLSLSAQDTTLMYRGRPWLKGS